MPRTARASVGEVCYHVLNRGSARREVFHSDDDYQAFIKLIEEGCTRLPTRALAWCIMPNHFHLVLWPYGDGVLGRWMHWLLRSHVRRYYRRYHSSEHVWQGRFKAFPIQHDEHLLTVLRYVERNPLRAKLVDRAQDWPWSSLSTRHESPPASILHPGPCPRNDDWLRLVNYGDAHLKSASLRQPNANEPSRSMWPASGFALPGTHAHSFRLWPSDSGAPEFAVSEGRSVLGGPAARN